MNNKLFNIMCYNNVLGWSIGVFFFFIKELKYKCL